MGFKKFLKNVKKTLGLDELSHEDNKKKSVKELCSKLHKRRRKIKEELKHENSGSRKKDLHEDLEIIELHIKNGKKSLSDLYSKK